MVLLDPGLQFDAPSYTHLPYRPGVPLVAGVLEGGELTWRDAVLWP